MSGSAGGAGGEGDGDVDAARDASTFDPEVRAAMARWPDVPPAYGWLALDARGNWLIQRAPIANRALRDFIARNYAGDSAGRWFFQNGPQRVFVDLARAPWICRLDRGALVTHGGRPIARLARAIVDEAGRITLQTELGAAALDDRDGAELLAALVDEDGRALDDEQLEEWIAGRREAGLSIAAAGAAPIAVERALAAQVPALLGFDPRPRPVDPR